MQDVFLTPTASGQTPTAFPHINPLWKEIPVWAVVVGQVVITLPLYLFSFWLMVEGIKAGGDTLIAVIDYLAFRP